MSKAVSKFDKNNHIVSQSKAQDLQIRHNSLSQLREVNVATVQEEHSNVIATYKDLNQPLKEFALNQNKQLLIGFAVFIILGLGILMGQSFVKSRGVASAEMEKLLPAGVAATSEHYHYDKSCYTGDNGEQVCMTRTSQKR